MLTVPHQLFPPVLCAEYAEVKMMYICASRDKITYCGI